MSKLRKSLQSFFRKYFFPASPDWYKTKGYTSSITGLKVLYNDFNGFMRYQRTDKEANYNKEFQGLTVENKQLKSQIANGKECTLDTITLKADIVDKSKPGNGKHLVMFYGANSYYQLYFRDLSLKAKETGATIHAFNYPGMTGSTGMVSEKNDLINSGLTVLYDLFKQGVKPDDIILCSDCFGGAVIEDTLKIIKEKEGVNIRRINSNSFKSFKSAVKNNILSARVKELFEGSKLGQLIEKVLAYAGWSTHPSKTFELGPYGAVIEREGDNTLRESTMRKSLNLDDTKWNLSDSDLADKDSKAKEELKSLNQKYKVELLPYSEFKVKDGELNRIKAKDPHEAKFYQLESKADSKVSMFDYINKYIELSNIYVKHFPQKELKAKEIPYQSQGPYGKLTSSEKEIIQDGLLNVVENNYPSR